MRLYTEADEEAFRARRLLKQWNDDGYLSKDQYLHLEQNTVCNLRTTNIYLRLVLLVFTLIGAGATIALFFTLTGMRPSQSTAGVLFLIFAAISYSAAELAATQARLYRYGIEEALAISSVALLCAGLAGVFGDSSHHSGHDVQFLACGVGAISALWLWHRFGLWYAFPAAMIFALFLPEYVTPSHSWQRISICVTYAVGLALSAAIRSRHRFDYLAQGYSLAEAFLWLGIYLVLNLKLSALGEFSDWLSPTRSTSGFSAPFYWTTWVLLWCLPPLILARGIRQKERFVIAVGIITTVLTLATNKPYLGWQRHTWDPMLLGIALIAVAVFLRRWLAKGPDGVRHGFTAASMSAKDKRAMSAAASVFSLLTPHHITPAPQPGHTEIASGGDSGGAGASGDF